MNTLFEKIAREIADQGVMPFARFMDRAMYCPVYGYYEAERDNVGKRGDFYTSVSVGSLFGELLAFQFAEWLAERGIPRCGTKRGTEDNAGPLRIIEGGAHDGRLAKDILTWLGGHRTEIFQQIEYWIVEPSARRREWQQQTLAEFGAKVRWFPHLTDVTAVPSRNAGFRVPRSPGICGIIFCNELLDAMPVGRFGWDAKQRAWFEWGVMVKDGRFVWARMLECAPQRDTRTGLSALGDLPRDLLDALPDGFTTEICPAAESWWREAAVVLKQGRLLAIDYGLCADEFFAAQRANGTLRAYSRHHLSDDALANVGEQDLTAHVNFTAIQAAGEAAGLKTEMLASQAQFLTRIAGQIWRRPETFGEWTASRTRQFQTLTHPEHLGRSFRVLVQARSAKP